MDIDDVVKLINALTPVAVVVLGAFMGMLTRWTVPRVRLLRSQLRALERRYKRLRAHVDDLYRAISQEPDGGLRILSRVKTRPPDEDEYEEGREEEVAK
ncbi:MAG TPA: hypothetical protein VEY08_15440 [Chloroflexia bacterium]|nr:hypothetical protein [Chloroflexia bacterium]